MKLSDISREEFLKKANAVCKASERKLGEAVEASSEADPNANQAELVPEGLILTIQAEIEEILEIGAPNGGEDYILEILGAMEDIVAEGEEDPETLIQGGPAAKRTEKLATAYGLTECPLG